MTESVGLVKGRAMDETLISDIYRMKRAGGSRGNCDTVVRVGRSSRESMVLKTMEKDSDTLTKSRKESNQNSASDLAMGRVGD